jgi:hypothetical protein
MSTNFAVQEVLISIVTEQDLRSALNIDLINASGIIPIEWKLCEQPITTDNLIQLSFQNGVTISISERSIYILEQLDNKDLNSISAPTLASNFVNKFSRTNYQKFTFEPKGHATFTGGAAQVHKYITETLISPGSWHKFRESQMLASNYLFIFTSTKHIESYSERGGITYF